MSVIPVENYSLLKADHNQQTQHDLNQLKLSIRQRESIINDLTRKIEVKRQQMRGLSKQVNSLIEKQAKKTTKIRPLFHPELPNEHLNKLRDQNEAVYKEIEQVKQQIRTLKGDESDQIVKAIRQQEGVLVNVEALFSKTEHEKQLLITQLQKNRDLMGLLQNNSCIQDLEKRQKEYEQVKRQCKYQEKEINQMTAYELQRNAYFFEMQYIVNREIIPQTIDTVDDQQIKFLIIAINNAQQQRFQVEKQAEAKILHNQQAIAQLEKGIREKHIQLRELQNDVLRQSLQSKRFKSHTAPKKLYTPNKTEKTQQTQQSFQPKIPKQNPEVHKQSSKKASHKAYLEQGKSLNIGNWEQGEQVLSDRYESWWSSIERMKYLTLFFKGSLVYGFKSTYIDKQGLLVEGKQQIIETDEQFQQLEVPLEDVTHIEYSRSGAPAIKFIINDGRQLSLGSSSTQMERINLDGLILKHIEAAILGDSIVGLRIAIGDKTVERSPEEMPERTVRTGTQRSFSNADLNLKRKILLKGRSLKKIREQPMIDHRLMLNKGKLV